MSSYTYVSYFTEEDIKPLKEAIMSLATDLESRKKYMHEKAFLAAKDRIRILTLAAEMLLEPVPRPFGG